MITSVEHSKAVVLLLLIHCLLMTPCFVGDYVWSLFCCALLCAVSSFVIILLGKRELIGLLYFYCLFNAILLLVSCVSFSRCRGLVCSVAFPGHTHLLFYVILLS